jgi:hypothetical protein
MATTTTAVKREPVMETLASINQGLGKGTAQLVMAGVLSKDTSQLGMAMKSLLLLARETPIETHNSFDYRGLRELKELQLMIPYGNSKFYVLTDAGKEVCEKLDLIMLRT